MTRRWITLCALSALLPLATACFGSFTLTRKIYDFNREISRDKWVREGVFLLLNVVPVYGTTTFLDAIFFNSVEFWTGKPILQQTRRTVTGEDGELAEATFHTDGSVELRLVGADHVEKRVTLERDGSALVLRAADGRVVALAERDGEHATLRRP